VPEENSMKKRELKSLDAKQLAQVVGSGPTGPVTWEPKPKDNAPTQPVTW
jgi:hypothetical protein